VAARVLAGDLGGTKTNLAIYAVGSSGDLTPLREASYPSAAFPSLEAVTSEFLAGDPAPLHAAAFGVAGPVIRGAARITNLPWEVVADALAVAIDCPTVRLLNDLETTAYGALHVAPEDVLTLNAGEPAAANRVVIAAGTGLGQALLCWDGRRHQAMATEGGHADFGPTEAHEIELLSFLRAEYARVSWERVLSGPGLHNIFRYLDERLHRPVNATIRARMAQADPSAVIGEAALAGECATCAEAVDLFVDLYGAQAGNLALTAMALGGVYVGGGIVKKLLPKIADGRFMARFLDKAPHRAVMERMPVWVLLNERTSLLGAAHAAAELLR
jgi:glucokinase